MKHLKSNSNEKVWQGIVYKMREAEEDSKRMTLLEERVYSILNEKKTNNTSPIIKKAPKKN